MIRVSKNYLENRFFLYEFLKSNRSLILSKKSYKNLSGAYFILQEHLQTFRELYSFNNEHQEPIVPFFVYNERQIQIKE